MERERVNTLRVKENKRAKDEDEAANENNTATHHDPPAQDQKEKAKAEDRKGPPRLPHVPLAIASPKIPAAIVVVPITPPELATKGRMKKRVTRVNNPTNRRISTFKSMKQP